MGGPTECPYRLKRKDCWRCKTPRCIHRSTVGHCGVCRSMKCPHGRSNLSCLQCKRARSCYHQLAWFQCRECVGISAVFAEMTKNLPSERDVTTQDPGLNYKLALVRLVAIEQNPLRRRYRRRAGGHQGKSS